MLNAMRTHLFSIQPRTLAIVGRDHAARLAHDEHKVDIARALAL